MRDAESEEPNADILAAMERYSSEGNIKGVGLYVSLAGPEIPTPWGLSRFLEAVVECPYAIDFEIEGEWLSDLYKKMEGSGSTDVELKIEDEIEYIEIRSRYLVEFAAYQSSLLDVFRADIEVRPPQVVRISNLNTAFSFIEKEAYEVAFREPLAVINRVHALQSKLLRLKGESHPEPLALRNAVCMMGEFGLRPLFPVNSADEAGELLERLFHDARAYAPPQKFGDLLTETYRLAFSGVDANSAYWREAWIDLLKQFESATEGGSRGVSSSVDVFRSFLASLGFDGGHVQGIETESLHEHFHRVAIRDDAGGEFSRECITERLPSYGRLLWREAATLRDMAKNAFEYGTLHDGGMVSLSHFRVLEVTYNFYVDRLIALVPSDLEPDEKYWQMLLAKADGMRIKSGKLMLNELRTFFDQMGSKYAIYLDEKGRRQLGESTWVHVFEGIDSILTESGKKALLASWEEGGTLDAADDAGGFVNGWSEVISEKAARKFRNPPAHTTFASFDVADECIDYVSRALAKILGGVGAHGLYEGWVRLPD